MMLSLLLIGGLAITILAVNAISTKSYDLAETASIGENSSVGLGDPANDTMVGNGGTSTSLKTEWNLTAVTALCDAEEMLDYLEMKGYPERELLVLGDSSFAVRWR
jgi:hypothetical protein